MVVPIPELDNELDKYVNDQMMIKIKKEKEKEMKREKSVGNQLGKFFKTVLKIKDKPKKEEMVTAFHKDGPFGAKGFSEGAMIGIDAAIANAIYNAIGVRIKDLPITPEKVLNALKSKNKEKK